MVEISKLDEVSIRVKCDRSIAQELSDYFTFAVPGYQFTPQYRMGVWDGKIRLYNVNTGIIYSGLSSYVEKFCLDRQYEYVYTYDNADFELSLNEAYEWLEKEKFNLTPRDYQVEAFTHAVRKERALLLSPTASGKSFIIYMILRWYLRPTLIVVPTEGLIHQMYSDFEEYGFNSSKYMHKIYSGQDKNTDKPVVISTWQSIYKLPRKWFEKFDVVIGDEAHNFKAKSLSTLLSKMTDTPYRFGFTGTLDGTQTHKLVLEGLFGPVKTVTTTKELMKQGHVADFSIKIINLKYDDNIRKVCSKLRYQQEMDFITTNEQRNKFIANLALSIEGNTLVLFQYVDKHGRPLYNMMKEMAPDRKIYFISGAVKGEDRDKIRKILETEDNSIIVASYGTTSTGVNIKRLKNAIFASPSKSKIRNLQSIGRTLRKTEHYDDAVLYDISDDLTWKSHTNYTLRHLMERIKIYDQEKFDYKLYNVRLKDGR